MQSLNNLKKISYVVWWHIYTVDKACLLKEIGIVAEDTFAAISGNIMDTLGFSDVFNI